MKLSLTTFTIQLGEAEIGKQNLEDQIHLIEAEVYTLRSETKSNSGSESRREREGEQCHRWNE